VNAAGLQSPVIIIVGETVSLAERLSWFATQEESDETSRADRR
jgi:hypothetical protein